MEEKRLEWEEPIPQPEPPKVKRVLLVLSSFPDGKDEYSDATLADVAKALGVPLDELCGWLASRSAMARGGDPVPKPCGMGCWFRAGHDGPHSSGAGL
jgi:hypothetical protein